MISKSATELPGVHAVGTLVPAVSYKELSAP